jgi:predicted nucleic acid-binding protein
VSFIVDRPPVVLDASVAVAAALQEQVGLVDTMARWTRDERLQLVPATFWPETANGLLVGNRVAAEEVRGHLADLAHLGIETADRGFDGALEAIDIAARHGLTVYDALYLQLAIDVDGQLATFDAALARAARSDGVDLEQL